MYLSATWYFSITITLLSRSHWTSSLLVKTTMDWKQFDKRQALNKYPVHPVPLCHLLHVIAICVGLERNSALYIYLCTNIKMYFFPWKKTEKCWILVNFSQKNQDKRAFKVSSVNCAFRLSSSKIPPAINQFLWITRLSISWTQIEMTTCKFSHNDYFFLFFCILHWNMNEYQITKAHFVGHQYIRKQLLEPETPGNIQVRGRQFVLCSVTILQNSVSSAPLSDCRVPIAEPIRRRASVSPVTWTQSDLAAAEGATCSIRNPVFSTDGASRHSTEPVINSWRMWWRNRSWELQRRARAFARVQTHYGSGLPVS